MLYHTFFSDVPAQLSGQGQEDATPVCWNLLCYMVLFVHQAALLYYSSVKSCKNKGREKGYYSFLYFLTPELQAWKKKNNKKTKPKCLTFTIHKFCRNKYPGSEAVGVKECKVHHLLTVVLKREHQRQILLG